MEKTIKMILWLEAIKNLTKVVRKRDLLTLTRLFKISAYELSIELIVYEDNLIEE